MAKFEISTTDTRNGYEERLELTVRLLNRPDKEDYDTLRTAIATIEEVFDKYAGNGTEVEA